MYCSSSPKSRKSKNKKNKANIYYIAWYMYFELFLVFVLSHTWIGLFSFCIEYFSVYSNVTTVNHAHPVKLPTKILLDQNWEIYIISKCNKIIIVHPRIFPPFSTLYNNISGTTPIWKIWSWTVQQIKMLCKGKKLLIYWFSNSSCDVKISLSWLNYYFFSCVTD